MTSFSVGTPISSAAVNAAFATLNGNASAASVTATGGTTLRTQADHASDGLYAKDFGIVADGVTDDSTKLNALITAVNAAGGGTIHLPAGSIVASGIVPKSRVKLVGAGNMATQFLVNGATFLAQTSAVQLSGFSLTHMRISAQSGTYAGSTVFSLTSYQQCEIAYLLIDGFTTGTILLIQGVRNTTFDFSTGGSNILWNNFHDWICYGVGTGMSIIGHYGTTPTSWLAGSANVPDLVVTQNAFKDIRFYKINTAGILILGAADNNTWENIWLLMGGDVNQTGIVGVNLSADPAYTGLTYASSNKFRGLVVSVASASVTGTIIKATNWCHSGEVVHFEHDIPTTQAGFTFLDTTNMQSFRLEGKRIDTVNANTVLFEQNLNVYSTSNVAPADTSTIITSPTISGSTVSAVNGTSLLVLNGGNTLAALTVAFPPDPFDGQSFAISSSNNFSATALTLTTNGHTLAGGISTVIPGTYAKWRYYAASNFWLPDSPIPRAAPVTVTATTHTVLSTTETLILNPAAGQTLTLGTAYAGRQLRLKLISAFAVISASSNVVPQAGGSAGTAILAATAGKWAMLQGDGTNWQIVMSN